MTGEDPLKEVTSAEWLGVLNYLLWPNDTKDSGLRSSAVLLRTYHSLKTAETWPLI